ncbi:MAG: iron-containing alcohol dehydrogenase [Chitinophagia bacterium]|nr:iron-containing alcohol dehydrogenase [Chitinophagia bacterium]
MSVVQFNFPTIIRFGAGAIDELPGFLLEQGTCRPLLVTDATIATLPFFTKILQQLESAGLIISVFHEIHKNPVKSDVYAGTNQYDLHACDAVIGLGGGAAIDVARAIVLRVFHRDDLFVYDDLIGGDVLVTGPVPIFVTVPTTAGTGSEVGRSAIIADDVTHQKKILFSPKLLAIRVFADPQLTVDLPPAITAATGMDALTHNMEAFLAKNYHPLCDGIALEGIRLIANALATAVNAPTLQSRSDMLLASMMGAIAFQKGLGVVHSLAHPMSALLDTHHGLANAVNLPYGLAFNASCVPEKFNRMAQVLPIEQKDAAGVIEWVQQLNQQIGIPAKLREVGVQENQLETLSQLALQDFAHPNNPQPVSLNDFRALYAAAF